MKCLRCGKTIIDSKCICGFDYTIHQFYSLFPDGDYQVEKLDLGRNADVDNKNTTSQYYEDQSALSDRDQLTARYSFMMPIENAFSITGRGIVVVGKVLVGSVKVGESAQVVFRNGKAIPVKISTIEMYRKILSEALAGDSVGLFLDGIGKKEELAGAWAIVNYR